MSNLGTFVYPLIVVLFPMCNNYNKYPIDNLKKRENKRHASRILVNDGYTEIVYLKYDYTLNSSFYFPFYYDCPVYSNFSLYLICPCRIEFCMSYQNLEYNVCMITQNNSHWSKHLSSIVISIFLHYYSLYFRKILLLWHPLEPTH